MSDEKELGKRSVYLKMISPIEAVHRIISALDRDFLVHSERIDSVFACGRVLSQPVQAVLSSPAFHSAAMDGIAVSAATSYDARESNPLTLLEGKDFIWINTGNPIPSGYDAVIMVEHVQAQQDNTVKIESPAFPWQHVRRLGEDIVATELLFTRNHALRPYDCGALLSGGIWEVDVWEKIKICIIPTGDEVLDVSGKPEPKPGQVIESNSHVIAFMAQKLGCEAKRMPIVPDRAEIIANAVNEAVAGDAHVIILCSGSSAGSRDYTREVMASVADSGDVLLHGINMMPGKPTLAAVSKGKLIMGVPGYPVSMYAAFEEILAKVLAWLGHTVPAHGDRISTIVARNIPSKPGMEELLRVSVGKVGDNYIATPLNRSAGCITSLTRAQGILRIPPESEGLSAGSEGSVDLLSLPDEIDKVLLCTGSHDNILDILADALMSPNSEKTGNIHADNVHLVSTNVGSMGGISALRQGACHLAGMHLFEPLANDFNFPFLKKYAPELDLVLINLAIRWQGLIVQRGNPKNISTIQDLARADVSFINRQQGAGTRILFDYCLKNNNIGPESIKGYNKDEFTHMAVAVNVLTGASDCGLGIMAAASALQLDFIPLIKERYDLAIPRVFLNDRRIVVLREIVTSSIFRDKIGSLGGYETTLTGQEMREGQGL